MAREKAIEAFYKLGEAYREIIEAWETDPDTLNEAFNMIDDSTLVKHSGISFDELGLDWFAFDMACLLKDLSFDRA